MPVAVNAQYDGAETSKRGSQGMVKWQPVVITTSGNEKKISKV